MCQETDGLSVTARLKKVSVTVAAVKGQLQRQQE